MEMGKGGEIGTERDFGWDNGHTMQCAEAVLLNFRLETCMVLLTSVNPINSIKNNK